MSDKPRDCEKREDGWVYCILCDDWWPPESVHAYREPLPLAEQIRTRLKRETYRG